MKNFFKDKFNILYLVTIFCTIIISTKWGPSTDEFHQQPYGKKAFDYYKSFGKDDTVVTFKQDSLMVYYGAMVDVVPEAMASVTGSDLFIMRHIWIAFISIFYIIYGTKIARKIGGDRAGILAFLFLLFYPRLFGEGFNNPKDPTFAAGYIASIYYLICILYRLPEVDRKDIIKCAIAIGLSISMRSGGVMLYFYAGLFILVSLLIQKANLVSFLKLHVKSILTFFGLSYSIGILFWPAALNSPINLPLESLTVFSKFPVVIKTLYDNVWMQSTELPKSYLPRYMFISTPEVVLLGFLFIPFVFKKLVSDKRKMIAISLILFSFLFPILTVIYKNSSFYNGWRHLYFSVVPAIVLSAILWDQFISNIENKKYQYIFYAIIAILLFLPASFMVRNFPQFYVYFNKFSGGIEKNYGKYEMDYYGHGVNEATFWIHKNHPEWLTDTTIRMVSNVPYNMQKILDRWNSKKFPNYIRFRERFDTDWEIGIFSPAFVDPAIMQNDLFKTKNTVHSIDIDGKPICIIVERKDKNDFIGKKLMDSNKFIEAIPFLTKAVQYDPNNEIAWSNLALAQLQSNQANLAIESANKALAISPESISAMNYLGYAYLQTGNASYAQSVFLKMIDENPNMPDPYRILAQIAQQQGNGAMAQQYMSIYQQITGQGQ